MFGTVLRIMCSLIPGLCDFRMKAFKPVVRISCSLITRLCHFRMTVFGTVVKLFSFFQSNVKFPNDSVWDRGKKFVSLVRMVAVLGFPRHVIRGEENVLSLAVRESA